MGARRINQFELELFDGENENIASGTTLNNSFEITGTEMALYLQVSGAAGASVSIQMEDICPVSEAKRNVGAALVVTGAGINGEKYFSAAGGDQFGTRLNAKATVTGSATPTNIKVGLVQKGGGQPR